MQAKPLPTLIPPYLNTVTTIKIVTEANDIMQADIIRGIRKIPEFAVGDLLYGLMTKTGETVLLYLADRGGGTRYDVKKEKGVSYSAVHDVFRRFLDKHMISEDRKEKSDRNITKVVYKPTVAGLLYALLRKPENPNIFRKVSEHFPWLLRKGDFFARHGIGEIIANVFLDRVTEFLAAVHRQAYSEEEELNRFKRETFKALLTWKDEAERLKVTRAICGDRELLKMALPVAREERELCLQERELYLQRAGEWDKLLRVLESQSIRKAKKARRVPRASA